MIPNGEPRARVLGGKAGWPTESNETRGVTAGEDGLVLEASPDGPLALGSPDGSLGGLVLPRGFALDGELHVYRLATSVDDRGVESSRVERLAFPADCPEGPSFQPLWPDPEDEGDPRRIGPRADLAVDGWFLIVADRDRLRVTVFDLRTLAVRTVWVFRPELPPLDVVASRGRVYVLVDRDVVRYRLGAHGPPQSLVKVAAERAWDRIALDRCGRVYLRRPAPGTSAGYRLDVFDPRTERLSWAKTSDGKDPGLTDAGQVRDRFDPPPVGAGEFRVGTRIVDLIAVPAELNRPFGRELPKRPPLAGQPLLPVALASRLPPSAASAGYDLFTPDGRRFQQPTGEEEPATPVAPPYRTRGVWVSRAEGIDSGIDRCVWDRAELDVSGDGLPAGAALVAQSFAADDRDYAPFEEDWSPIAVLRPPSGEPSPAPLRAADASATDGLIGGTPGRHLRLKVELTGDGYSTPRVRRVAISYPRDSYLQYLPAVFQQDERGRDFLERFLAVIRAEWDGLEKVAQNTWRYFDPTAVPETAAQVGYLARWLGLPLEAGWTTRQNRELLKEARSIYAGPPEENGEPGPSRRGTVDGLRRYLRVYLRNMTGLQDRDFGPFPVVVEGFRERRAVRIGAGVAGGPGRLGGAGDAGRVTLDRSRLGEDRLISPGDPARDSVDRFAHTFRVLVPAAWVRTAEEQAMLRRAIAAEKPAHTAFELTLLPSAHRVGVRSTVGVDTIIGPADGGGITLGVGPPAGPAAVLGAPTGTPSGILVQPPIRVGRETNLT